MKVFEMMVGLHVSDDQSYTEYRKGMIPILENHGGGFRYDFKVSEVLKTAEEKGKSINRVFAIYFQDKDKMSAFFAHEDYLQVKKDYFEGAVEETVILSQYELEI